MELIDRVRFLSYGGICQKFWDKNYKFYTGQYNLNIFGVRSYNTNIGQFDDVLGIAYEDNHGKQLFLARATTDPGKYYAQNFTNTKGVAILVPGQYRGAYQIGTHSPSKPAFAHRALVQCKGVCVYRDRNKDNILDYDSDTIEEGMFGINIHRASKHQIMDDIGKYSAGCQVFRSFYDFNDFMDIVDRGAKEYGNGFTYTLFTEKDIFS